MFRRALAAACLLALAAHPIPAFAQQNAADGERLFRTQCGACHSVTAGQNRIGPNLAGVFGRKAGSADGARYSSAMKDSSLVWDEKALDTYLANPRQAVPGTTMTIAVRNEGQRSAIIAYLRSLPQAN